jgi:hypothetical protein
MTVEVAWLDDPMIWTLSQVLKVDEGAALGYVVRLRLWAIVHAPALDITRVLGVAGLAHAARYGGDPHFFWEGLRSAGVVVPCPEGGDKCWHLARWVDPALEKLLKERANDARNARTYRARHKGQGQPNSQVGRASTADPDLASELASALR